MTTPPILPYLSAPPAAPKTWRVGTLVYDRRALINVFVWMLWGDFCLYLMDAGVGNNLITLQLQRHGASNTMIAIVKTSVVELLILVLCPIVSTWSDRHRSRLGRRIPFMLYATPPLAMFLTLIGFSPAIAQWLRSISPQLAGSISAATLTVALISVLNVGYKFCDIFPQSVYYYLWADVIPAQLMGTFSCLFRVFSTAGVFVFNMFLLGHADDHAAAIFTGAAGLYLVSFLMLCIKVKEGEYPPPEPSPEGAGVIGPVTRFVRESYSKAFYWKYYLFLLLFMVGFVPFRDFLILYAQKELNMDLGSYGRVMALSNAVQIGIFLGLGPIVDRLHPLRAGLWGYALVCVAVLGSFIFIQSASSFRLWVVIIFGAVAIYQGATGAIGPLLLPRAQYGQFCAASAVVFHLGQMLLTPVVGILTDHYGNRAIFPWFFSFSAAGLVALYLVYRDWKSRGGDESFQPP